MPAHRAPTAAPSTLAHGAPDDPARVPREFVEALGRRDAAAIERCFSARARLRALVPKGPQEHHGSASIARVFVHWFGSAERLELVESVTQPIAGRLLVRYRFREHYPDGSTEMIQQDAFCDLEDGRIAGLDLVCSGHLAEPTRSTGGAYRFDAGELGCGSGLPEEFRRQIAAIPVGSVLEVLTRDPSAKEDLPALARLLGHRFVSLAPAEHGAHLLRFERGP